MHAPRTRRLRWRPSIAALLALGFALSACQQIEFEDSDDDEDWVMPDIPWGEAGGDDDPPGSGSSGGGNPTNSGNSESGSDPKLDMPPGDIPAAPCSVVDLLFVIDNSNSMLAEQANLIASFDGFIAGIQDKLDEANDYHIGVVTTDAYAANEPDCQTLGALVTQTPMATCGPFAAGRFISLADDLETAFTCAANLGGDGNTNERQIEAALRAISPELNAQGACNEGFIRDDALLVIVLITDEDDGTNAGQGSPGEPHEWFEQVVARKGFESNVVVLALAGVPPPNACQNDEPFEGSALTWRIADFVERFSYGQMGDVCADNYASFFDTSLAVIKTACTNFTPEG